MSARIVYLNGAFVPESQARVSFYDAGVQTGEMAFESTRTFAGRPFELHTHLQRLFGSLDLLGIDCGHSLSELEQLTRATLDRNRSTAIPEMEWQILHNISAGPTGDYVYAFPESALRPTVCIQCFPLLPRLARLAPHYDHGVRLVIPQQRALPAELVNPHAKTRSRAHAKLALKQAAAMEPAAWPLLLTVDGFVAEGTSWNVFLVHEGILKTPSLQHVLPGVSRSHTLQLAKNLGIPVSEVNIPPEMLSSASEVFCTATSFCLLHATAINGVPIGNTDSHNQPGPVFQQLTTAWKQLVGVDFVQQARFFAEQLPEWIRQERQSASGEG